MTSRLSTLKSAADFQAVFKGGRRSNTPSLTIIACPNTLGQQRVGFVITKKLDKRATRRNYLRRCLNEALRTNPELLVGFSAHDLVFMVKLAPAEKVFATFLAELTQWAKRS